MNAPTKRAAIRRPKRKDGWREYEAKKQQWLAANPSATPRQYEQAMARIARQCGL